MTNEEIRKMFIDAVGDVAPDTRGRDIADDADLRDVLELDSMDMLRVLAGVKERSGVEVAEIDTPKLYTLGGAVAYLKAKLG